MVPSTHTKAPPLTPIPIPMCTIPPTAGPGWPRLGYGVGGRIRISGCWAPGIILGTAGSTMRAMAGADIAEAMLVGIAPVMLAVDFEEAPAGTAAAAPQVLATVAGPWAVGFMVEDPRPIQAGDSMETWEAAATEASAVTAASEVAATGALAVTAASAVAATEEAEAGTAEGWLALSAAFARGA
jgi:hypothetical protein